MSEIPSQFKVLTTYIRRAEELDKNTANPNSPIIAYFCRYYALEKGLKLNLPQNDNKFLFALMEQLEKSSARTTAAEGKPICEDFATHVFELADAEDRGPQGSTMGTARSFYACAAFFDILEQFGELENYFVEKRRYSKWKAADIVKSIKEGRKPCVGGVGEEPEAAAAAPVVPMAPAPTPSPVADIPAAPTVPMAPAPTVPMAPAPVVPMAPAPTPSPVANIPTVPTAAPQPVFSYPSPVATGQMPINNTDPRVMDCMEYCSFAIAAMKKNEIPLAKKRLQDALQLLG